MQDRAGRAWSRRSLIGAGLGAAAAMPLLSWAEPAPEGAVVATGSSGKNLLTIGVTIDGKGPFPFVVDTGADRSVIADNVVRELGLAAGAPMMVEGVVRTVSAQSARIASVVAGPVERERLELPVLPREQLGADGYLGLDVINGYRLWMDFRHAELRLLEPRSSMSIGNDAANEVPVRLAGNGGHLRAFQCSIDKVGAVAFIDTGAEISVGNPALQAALNARSAALAAAQVIPLTGVTGGLVEGRVMTLNRIRLGGLDIDDSRIAVAPLQIFKLWDLDDRPALLIGMNWLRRFNRVAIDYGRKEVRFDLAAAIRKEPPLRCQPGEDCRYWVGSPITMPRPSVAI